MIDSRRQRRQSISSEPQSRESQSELLAFRGRRRFHEITPVSLFLFVDIYKIFV